VDLCSIMLRTNIHIRTPYEYKVKRVVIERKEHRPCYIKEKEILLLWKRILLYTHFDEKEKRWDITQITIRVDGRCDIKRFTL